VTTRAAQTAGQFQSRQQAVGATLIARAFRQLKSDIETGYVKIGTPLVREKALAESSLIEFVRLMWAELEPKKPFVEGWAVRAIAEHLEAVSSGQILNLLVNVPPGCTKSLLTNVFWPAWEWGPRNRPDLRVLSASYIDKLAVRDNISMRRLVTSDRYRQLWGDRFELSEDQNNTKKFSNDHTGWKAATHVSGATGERGDRLVIDDPHNVQEAESDAKRGAARTWFTETAPTRVNDARSAIVVIMQRIHQDDISGLILEKELGFEHLCLPMRYEEDRPKTTTVIGFSDPRTKEGELLWPERFPPDEVVAKERWLSSIGGEYAVAGQFQQRPVPRGGGMFKQGAVTFVDVAPRGGLRARGWDLAASRDKGAAFTVGVKLALVAGKVYVEDVVRGQWGPHEVEQNILATARKDGHGVVQSLPQDPGQSGVSQREALAALLGGFNCYFSPETGSKEDRAIPFAAQWNAGNVVVVQAPWNDAYLSEACAFPTANWKDQVDASSRAYAKVLMLIAAAPSVGVPIIVR